MQVVKVKQLVSKSCGIEQNICYNDTFEFVWNVMEKGQFRNIGVRIKKATFEGNSGHFFWFLDWSNYEIKLAEQRQKNIEVLLASAHIFLILTWLIVF